jgi:hypothetical protein
MTVFTPHLRQAVACYARRVIQHSNNASVPAPSQIKRAVGVAVETDSRYLLLMTGELPTQLEDLALMLSGSNLAAISEALDAISKVKGRGATTVLCDYLRRAPVGILASKAAGALEVREHKSCLPAMRELFEQRPELADDIIPIFAALRDNESIPLIVENLHELLSSNARLSTLTYLLKLADREALADVFLPMILADAIPGGKDDLRWALETILDDADDDLLTHVKETAVTIGPEALELVQPFMPAESELEKAAPKIARSFLQFLLKGELLEMDPEAEEALVLVLTNTICEARSPKGLVRDVERILMESTAVEEVYASRDDIRTAFSSIAE